MLALNGCSASEAVRARLFPVRRILTTHVSPSTCCPSGKRLNGADGLPSACDVCRQPAANLLKRACPLPAPGAPPARRGGWAAAPPACPPARPAGRRRCDALDGPGGAALEGRDCRRATGSWEALACKPCDRSCGTSVTSGPGDMAGAFQHELPQCRGRSSNESSH